MKVGLYTKVVLTVIAIVGLSGCAEQSEKQLRQQEQQLNRREQQLSQKERQLGQREQRLSQREKQPSQKLLRLKLGMTIEEARAIMGPPPLTETKSKGGIVYTRDIYLYKEAPSPDAPMLLFENNKLCAWGPGLAMRQGVE